MRYDINSGTRIETDASWMWHWMWQYDILSDTAEYRSCQPTAAYTVIKIHSRKEHKVLSTFTSTSEEESYLIHSIFHCLGFTLLFIERIVESLKFGYQSVLKSITNLRGKNTIVIPKRKKDHLTFFFNSNQLIKKFFQTTATSN